MGWLSKFSRRRGASAPAAADRKAPERLAADVPLLPLRARKAPRTPDFPRFQSTASDQASSHQNDPATTARMRFRAAFTPSQPVVDRRMFAGRGEVLTSMIRSIEDQRLHTVIYGVRGIGKTSMLHVLSQAARDARYIVTYVSCGASSNLDETFRAIAGNIPLLFHSQFDPTTSEAETGATLKDLLGPQPVTVRVASDLLARIVGTRVLIILDEFDRCELAEFRYNIAELMKNLSDRSVRVQFIIAGVAANLDELVEHIPSIQRNVYALQVPPMGPAELRDLVRNGEDLSGLTFTDDAVRAIVRAANGLPYIASLLSHHAGLAAIDAGETEVRIDDVKIALAEALAEFNGRLSRRAQNHISESLDKSSIELLCALAESAQKAGGFFSLEVLREKLSNPANVTRCIEIIERLEAREILVQRVEDEFGLRHRFIEEGVPTYLWLLSEQSRLSVSRERAPATGA